MKIKLLMSIFCLSLSSLHASDNANKSELAHAFDYNDPNFFSKEVNEWSQKLFEPIKEEAKKSNSDYAKTLLRWTNLNNMAQSDSIKAEIKSYWDNKISNNTNFKNSYNKAISATREKKSLEERINCWRAFREQSIAVIHPEMIALGIKRPKLDPVETFAQRKITVNEKITLDTEMQNKILALIVIQHVARQINLNSDSEAENQNAIFPKEYTLPTK